MTLNQALAKADAELDRIFDELAEGLVAEFRDYATAEEMAGILARHEATRAEAKQTTRAMVTAEWFTGSGSVH